MISANEIAQRLSGKKTAKGFECLCPAHSDSTASLSVSTGEDGRTLMHCHAGCSFDAVCAALAIKPSDLMPPSGDAQKPCIVATYDYTDAQGKLLYQKVRYAPKSFRQRRPDPDRAGEFIWNMQGVERVLYNLPEVLRVAALSGDIFVVEGEKDADALRERLGLCATCNPDGAGKWQDSFTASLTGAHVTIIADKDDAGRKHAELVRANLTGKAASVAVVELPDRDGHKVKDAHDWIACGGTAEELAEIIKAQTAGPLDKLPRSYAFAYIETPPPPLDPILDGVFECGDKVPIIGSSKSRKTFFVSELSMRLSAGHAQFLGWKITRRRRVLYLQYEVKASHYHRRINYIAHSIGVSVKDIGDNLLIYNLRGHHIPVDLISAAATAHRAEVIVIDPLYVMLEGDENAACDMKPMLAAFGRIAEETGAALVYVHHNGKGMAGDRDARDRGAGSGVLARDMDAAIYLTDHKDDGYLVVETITRNFPPTAPFTVEWFDGKFEMAGEIEPEVRTSKNKNTAEVRGLPELIQRMKIEHPSMSVREIARVLSENGNKCSVGTVFKYLPREKIT